MHAAATLALLGLILVLNNFTWNIIIPNILLKRWPVPHNSFPASTQPPFSTPPSTNLQLKLIGLSQKILDLRDLNISTIASM